MTEAPFTFPDETIEIVRKAISASKARDDEGEFPTLWDHLDYSGENKAVTVTRQAAIDALNALGREKLIDPIFVKAAKDAERSMMLELQQDCISLRVALATARDQFRRYQGEHEAKGMDTKRTETERQQARDKGETNGKMAAMCQKAIDGSRKRTPSQDPTEADAAATVRTIEAAAAAGLLPARISGNIGR